MHELTFTTDSFHIFRGCSQGDVVLEDVTCQDIRYVVYKHQMHQDEVREGVENGRATDAQHH